MSRSYPIMSKDNPMFNGKSIPRLLLTLVLSSIAGMVIPVQAQEATDAHPFTTNIPQVITVIADATPDPAPVLLPDTDTPVIVGDGGIVLVDGSDRESDLKALLNSAIAIGLILA